MRLYLTLFIVLLISSCKNTKLLPYAETNKDYKEAKSEVNSNNVIYPVGTVLTFDYIFIRKDTIKALILDRIPNNNSNWSTLNYKMQSDSLIDKVSVTLTEGTFFDFQSEIQFDYINPKNRILMTCWTGIIENKHEIWWHPPRYAEFNLTEFNPFPYIKYPLKKGIKWKGTISPAPNSHNYGKWIQFDELIDCKATYEIVGEVILDTKFGKLKCFVTEATAVNPYGKGSLTSYFNEKYGFVKLDYINIDGSQLIIDLIKHEYDSESISK